jgi:hypothetical protein
MGKSYTIHCIGEGRDKNIGKDTNEHYLYMAMSRLEIMQETRKARRHGDEIVRWYAQTKTGKRILGGWDMVGDEIATIPHCKGAILCPICNGQGKCQACNFSGITTSKIIHTYQFWQLEEMREAIKKGGQ